MEITRNPMRDRTLIISSDVADGIELLVSRWKDRWPVTMTLDAVALAMYDVYCTYPDGTVKRESAMAAPLIIGKFKKALETASLANGCSKYEERSNNLIVPVNRFFFTEILPSGADARQALMAMTDGDAGAVLPKRNAPTEGLVVFRNDTAAHPLPKLYTMRQRAIIAGSIEALTENLLAVANPVHRERIENAHDAARGALKMLPSYAEAKRRDPIFD